MIHKPVKCFAFDQWEATGMDGEISEKSSGYGSTIRGTCKCNAMTPKLCTLAL